MKRWSGRNRESQCSTRGQGATRNRRRYRGRQRRPSWDDRWNGYGDAGPSFRRSQGRSDNQCSSSSSSNSSAAPELPGFYFDPEKNRYFRLLPGHNNCNPLTREQLRNKEQEKERNRMLVEDGRSRKKAPRAGLNSLLLLQKRRLGLLPEMSYCRRVHEGKVGVMRRHELQTKTTDNFRHIVADSACEQVFTVNDMAHGGCKYGVMSFSSNAQRSLSVETCDNLYVTYQKVNSLCWASVNYPNSHVLLCLVGGPHSPSCVTLLPASLFGNFNPDQPGMLYNFKMPAAWSCAWCLHPKFDKMFSVGLSHKVVVQHAVTAQKQTISVGSDVLAQQFCAQVPVLFNGCRSGEIFGTDLRQLGSRRDHSWKTTSFRQESAITCVRVLQDDNFLVAADMSGQIKLWDVRATKPVQEYRGHHNEHAHLPVHVSEPEGLLLAVGQDCHTRFWSLRDGHLLRTIPSPHPAANDAIPSVVFSSNIGGHHSQHRRPPFPGLLMAVKQDVFYFPYNTDYPEGGEMMDI
ncbi:WD repeat domain 21 isoform X1 [Dunckerocampus dactyliophorus]|uniref:WD repeat domain 21 isoform X1 n=1 Tax=Dunckerocampus dactyliophorus TaxID=161453 RepID=UPI002405522F|nr:WD repeat domain 21 isoform X1 [Dunckerocampus dactyliophorus]XP_054617712.1 WD repeat domain 21 isoform X1 [Dunckerocampus dactyliophorus]XP_054617713.1 WD repeat domain 21 isoform X1 [Dunckerocampus dactyliophorus]